MSSDANPQPYGPQAAGPPPAQPPPYAPQPGYQPQPGFQPQPGQQQPGQPQPGQAPPGYQPPVQQPVPYVEPGVPVPPGAGGQPPYVPPGGYVPVPPPQGPRGNRAAKVVAAIAAVAVVAAVGAVVLFQFVFKGGPDPAASFPASASMYMEVNLDPSFDQTPKLLEHLSKFEDLDYDSTDDLLTDLLEEADLEGVDADEDLNSWLGGRHGIAMWEYEDQPYAVLSLASTDAGAAEDGLADLRAAAEADEDQMAYVVEDDHVLIVAGESGAEAALDAARSEAGTAPLAEATGYEEARSWLDGDQLVVYWVDVDSVAEVAGLVGGEDAELLSEYYSGQAIAGLSAFDDGFELTYKLFGEADDPWVGSEDLMADMGDLPASDFAVSAAVPEDLAETVEEWTSAFEEEGAAEEEAVEPSGEPLTDAEYEEYLALETDYYAGTLDAEAEARFLELEQRYWLYGTEDDPYTYEDDYSAGYDFSEFTDVADLLSGASLTLAGNFDAEAGVNPESVFFRALLAEDRAADLEALLQEAWPEGYPDGVESSGSELSYTGPDASGGTLAEDSRFSDFAAAAPSSTAVAVWVDLAAAQESFPEEFEGAEPLSAVAWAHGSEGGDGSGVVRLYLTD